MVCWVAVIQLVEIVAVGFNRKEEGQVGLGIYFLFLSLILVSL